MKNNSTFFSKLDDEGEFCYRMSNSEPMTLSFMCGMKRFMEINNLYNYLLDGSLGRLPLHTFQRCSCFVSRASLNCNGLPHINAQCGLDGYVFHLAYGHFNA